MHQQHHKRFFAPPAEIYSSCIVLPILSIVVVTIRLYVRKRQAQALSVDDLLQIPNLCLFIALGIVGLVGVSHKALWYPWKNDSEAFYQHFKLFAESEFIMLLITAILLATIKISALFFFRRMFRLNQKGWLSRVNTGLIVLQVLWSIVFVFWNIFDCGKRPALKFEGPRGGPDFWNRCVPEQTKYDRAFAISDWILDLTVLIVPLPSIWRLHMSVKKKLGVTFVFMLALFGFCVSTVRVVYWLRGDKYVALPNSTTFRKTRLLNTGAFWLGVLEAGTTLMSVNLPPLWGLLSEVATGWSFTCKGWARSLRRKASRPKRGKSNRQRNADQQYQHYIEELEAASQKDSDKEYRSQDTEDT